MGSKPFKGEEMRDEADLSASELHKLRPCVCACVLAAGRGRDLMHRCTGVKTAYSKSTSVWGFTAADQCLRHTRCNRLTVSVSESSLLSLYNC